MERKTFSPLRFNVTVRRCRDFFVAVDEMWFYTHKDAGVCLLAQGVSSSPEYEVKKPPLANIAFGSGSRCQQLGRRGLCIGGFLGVGYACRDRPLCTPWRRFLAVQEWKTGLSGFGLGTEAFAHGFQKFPQLGLTLGVGFQFLAWSFRVRFCMHRKASSPFLDRHHAVQNGGKGPLRVGFTPEGQEACIFLYGFVTTFFFILSEFWVLHSMLTAFGKGIAYGQRRRHVGLLA
jgi:hypothetical protein